MHTKALITSAVTALLLASACTTGPTKEQTGTVVGGVLGGVIGSQVGDGHGRTAATIIGAIAGGLVGGAVGRSMSETDKLKSAQALETARTGEATQWRNPDSGNQYTVTPTRTYQSAEGPCRDYRMNGVIDGRTEVIQGTACRQNDGNWRVNS